MSGTRNIIARWARRVLMLLLVLVPVLVNAQDDGKKTKKQKKAEAKKEEQKAQSQKSEVKARKAHLKMQDKKTRKRMKKNRKRGSGYVSHGDNQGFFRKIFKKPQ